MCKMLTLLSHRLTEEQKKDARNTLGVSDFMELPDEPEEIKGLWMKIPPTMPSLSEYLEPLRRWLKENSTPGDYVLIQGDFGAVYLMVNYGFSLGLIPVYSTTERIVMKERRKDNAVKSERIFKHKMFRIYENI